MESILAHQVGDKSILIVGDKFNGLGDLSCARKVADVYRRLGGISAKQIIIASNEKDAFGKIFDPEGDYRVIPTKEIPKLKNIAFGVVAPYLPGNSGPELACNGFPALCLGEYDCSIEKPSKLLENITAHYPLGLGKDALGLLIDPELKEWASSEDAKDPIKRAQQLQELDKDFQTALFGNKTHNEFAATTSLYVGYASKHYTKLAFVSAICQADAKEDKDLTFVLPGASPIWDNKLEFPGIKEVQILHRSDDGTIKKGKTHALAENGKRVTLICGDMTQPQLKVLWKASERDALTTGDQSLTEGVSANKSVTYENLFHKNTLAERLTSQYSHNRDLCVVPSYRTQEMASNMLPAILSRRAQDYKMTDLGNRQIWKDHHCGRKLIEAAVALLKRSANATYPEDLRRLPLKDPAKDLPFGKTVMLTLDQVCSLSIRHDGTSTLPELEGSHFETQSLRGGSLYLLKRTKA